MAALAHSVDPTLAALDVLHAQAFSGDTPRPYLGASQIGDPCSRKIWYGFRWTIPRTFPATSYRAIQDGHRGEAVMINWLRSLPGIELWTHDPDEGMQQIGFVDCAGHFRGHLDGIISGLYQAPATPHVWEHKVCNETKFNKLVKLIQQLGEKNALKEWDEVYFAQSQTYMDQMELTRHYLTVATPGNRAIVSCRTAYQPKVAKAILAKAESIITAERPPLKLSENASWYQCKLCDCQSLCHGSALPAVNCRTCAHSTARLNPDTPWTCELGKPAISGTQRDCEHHAFHPDLLANHAEAVGADSKTGAIKFRAKAEPFGEFVNGIGGISSQELLDKSKPQVAPEPAIEDEVRAALAIEMEVNPSSLIDGDLDEDDFSRMTDAVRRISVYWTGDDRRMQTLRAVIEQADIAWMALCERTAMRVAG